MSTQLIDPLQMSQLLAAGTNIDFIDVRTPPEYSEVHAQGTRLIPLDSLNAQTILAGRNGAGDRPIYFICKSGARAAKACDKFRAAGFENTFSVTGGTEAWAAAGLPVVRGPKAVSLERQVRIAAGSLVLLGLVLGYFVHRGFFGVSAFIAAGLIFSGVTNTCGMGMLLAKMPWNRCARVAAKC
jgi:rhodanese-related sulfurtransferase